MRQKATSCLVTELSKYSSPKYSDNPITLWKLIAFCPTLLIIYDLFFGCRRFRHPFINQQTMTPMPRYKILKGNSAKKSFSRPQMLKIIAPKTMIINNHFTTSYLIKSPTFSVKLAFRRYRVNSLTPPVKSNPAQL